MPINPQIAILQCTAGYPAEWSELDLRVIETYRRRFPDVVVGFSGHDNGIAMPVVAYVLGARVVEKHFTLNRAMKGTDHALLARAGRPAASSCATSSGRASRSETATKAAVPERGRPDQKMGKKLVAATRCPPVTCCAREDLALKSPGDGLPPFELDNVIGRTLRHPLVEDDAVMLEHLEEPLPALEPAGAPSRADDEH